MIRYTLEQPAMIRIMVPTTRIAVLPNGADLPEPGDAIQFALGADEPPVDALTATCSSVMTVTLHAGALHITTPAGRAPLGPSASNNIAQGAGFAQGRALRRHLSHIGNPAHLITFQRKDAPCSQS